MTPESLFPPAKRTIELRERYFEKTPGLLCLYRLKEVVYDENNRAVGISFGDRLWKPEEADIFVEMCGEIVTTAEERIAGFR